MFVYFHHILSRHWMASWKLDNQEVQVQMFFESFSFEMLDFYRWIINLLVVIAYDSSAVYNQESRQQSRWIKVKVPGQRPGHALIAAGLCLQVLHMCVAGSQDMRLECHWKDLTASNFTAKQTGQKCQKPNVYVWSVFWAQENFNRGKVLSTSKYRRPNM